MEIDPNNPVKEYTGVWIPKEVMECEELSATEKIAYGEIAGFNTCYASNAWLAKRIGKNEWTASVCVSKLIKLGFVENCGFNGRFRLIRVVKNHKACEKSQCRVVKNHKAALQKITNIDKSIEKSKDKSKINNIDKSILLAEPPQKYGNENVEKAFDLWKTIMGYPLKESDKRNRQAAYNIMRAKDKGEKWLEGMLKILCLCQKDRFAPKEAKNISNLYELQRDWEHLLNWYRINYAQKTKIQYNLEQL